MSTAPKVGPLTQADLQAIWESTTDPSFWRPIEQAGEGQGFEAYEQAWAQGVRVSQAVDLTTQGLFMLPWSGQSAPPADLPQNATVTLSIARTGKVSQVLVLSAGTLVDEQITDWGVPEGVQVLTGRRYALNSDLVFEPGISGPLTVTATAERPGYGYNNPFPGTITVIEQAGSGFNNSDATLRGVNYPAATISISTTSRVFLDAIDEADAFIPQHVGQYLLFTGGSNVGTVARIIGWLPPNLSVFPPTGGTVELELVQAFQSFAGHFSGTFTANEILTLKNGASVTGFGQLKDVTAVGTSIVVSFKKIVGSAVTSIVGNTSGASATVDVSMENVDFTPEVGTAEWLILDWVNDWGLSATNPLSPSGGRAGMLNALAKERGIFQQTGESADQLRKRASQLADVVTPNAVKRALNKTIPGVPWCFREAGDPVSFPGFFFDVDAFDYDAIAFTYSGSPTLTGFIEGEKVVQVGTGGALALGRAIMGSPAVGSVPAVPALPTLRGLSGIRGTFVAGAPIVGQTSGATVTPLTVVGGLRSEDRFRFYFDFESMRAWFYVGLPPGDDGEFGFSYDNFPVGAYDSIGFFAFYDGTSLETNQRNLFVQAAVDKVRAGGVGFDIIENDGTCP